MRARQILEYQCGNCGKTAEIYMAARKCCSVNGCTYIPLINNDWACGKCGREFPEQWKAAVCCAIEEDDCPDFIDLEAIL